LIPCHVSEWDPSQSRLFFSFVRLSRLAVGVHAD
jgi:hypothetical protein